LSFFDLKEKVFLSDPWGINIENKDIVNILRKMRFNQKTVI